MNKNNHTTAIVPIEVWAYNSPYLVLKKMKNDIGLFAEALIYYDQVYVVIQSEAQFYDFVFYFEKQGKINLLIDLIRSGVVKFYHYSYLTALVNKDNVFHFVNIQDTEQEKKNVFLDRIIYKSNIEKFTHANKRSKIYSCVAENYIEEKATGNDLAIINSREGSHDKHKCDMLLQSFLNNFYIKLNLGHAPIVDSKVENKKYDDEELWRTNWYFDFRKINELSENQIDFRNEMPFLGLANSNKFLYSAAKNNFDLFLGDVMSDVTGNTIAEANAKSNSIKKTIDMLESKVEYPDIRTAVNSNILNIETVIQIRNKAKKFRNWLQSGADRDRDQIIAYHNEVSKELGFSKFAAGTLKLFGFIFKYGYPIYEITSPTKNAVSIGSSPFVGTFLDYLANKIDEKWAPVVFGEWVKKKVVDNQKTL